VESRGLPHSNENSELLDKKHTHWQMLFLELVVTIPYQYLSALPSIGFEAAFVAFVHCAGFWSKSANMCALDYMIDRWFTSC
jgi:hypothetical protein